MLLFLRYAATASIPTKPVLSFSECYRPHWTPLPYRPSHIARMAIILHLMAFLLPAPTAPVPGPSQRHLHSPGRTCPVLPLRPRHFCRIENRTASRKCHSRVGGSLRLRRTRSTNMISTAAASFSPGAPTTRRTWKRLPRMGITYFKAILGYILYRSS